MTLIKKIKDKKVNFEFNKEYIKVVTDKIASNDALFITNSFKEMHPADAADIIEHLSENDRENLKKLKIKKLILNSIRNLLKLLLIKLSVMTLTLLQILLKKCTLLMQRILSNT